MVAIFDDINNVTIDVKKLQGTGYIWSVSESAVTSYDVADDESLIGEVKLQISPLILLVRSTGV